MDGIEEDKENTENIDNCLPEYLNFDEEEKSPQVNLQLGLKNCMNHIFKKNQESQHDIYKILSTFMQIQ